jgi:hypothetical protein
MHTVVEEQEDTQAMAEILPVLFQDLRDQLGQVAVAVEEHWVLRLSTGLTIIIVMSAVAVVVVACVCTVKAPVVQAALPAATVLALLV